MDANSAQQNSNAAAATQLPSVHHESSVARGWCRSKIEVQEFSFTWIIDNLAFCKEAGKDQYLESLNFFAGSAEKLEWKLRVYPKKVFDYRYYFSPYLVLVSSYASGVLAKFRFFILNAKGEKAKSSAEMSAVFYEGHSHGFEFFLENQILMNKANGFLPDNNLTILCEGSFTLGIVHVSSPSDVHQTQDAERKISQDLGSLFENQKFTDVTLSVDGKDLLVHKVILAARSPVFAAMFEHKTKESQESRIVIKDVSYEALKEMVKYIYTGKLPNADDVSEDLPEILVLADKYDLDGLKAWCETVLSSSLTVENAAKLLILAEMHNAKKLEAQVGHFISIRAKEVTLTPAWREMSSKYPQVFIKAFEALAIF